jgi:cholinesterase
LKILTVSGFSTGNTANPVYDGSVLADENDVVVISANYRLNIFGFPAAPGLSDINVGLLDQRMAIEWARDNVEKFGGDPARITLFGQSAGGASVDLYAYTYPDDPIIHATIPESGAATVIPAANSTNNAAWYALSDSLGCGGSSAGTSTVACMRQKSMADIVEAIKNQKSSALQSGFTPVPDGKIVFDDYVARGKAGKFAKIPVLTGTVDQEAKFFALTAASSLTLSGLEGFLNLNGIPVKFVTLSAFTCQVANSAAVRELNGVPSWRYRYYANYSNVRVPFIGGTYHTSELFQVFGTAASSSKVADTTEEEQFSKYLRNAWATFAKNPTTGLKDSLSWPTYSPNCESIKEGQIDLRFY